MRVRDVGLREFVALANEPDVLPYINPAADFVDLTPIWKHPGVLVKGCEGINGAVLVIRRTSSAYEVHWFMPGYGGYRAIRAVVDWLFKHTNVDVLFGSTPKQNLQARIVNRALGGSVIKEGYDEFGRPSVTYALTREEWASSKAKESQS